MTIVLKAHFKPTKVLQNDTKLRIMKHSHRKGQRVGKNNKKKPKK